jgi:hypothetical protein
VTHIEAGVIRDPRCSTAARLARALDIDPGVLLSLLGG